MTKLQTWNAAMAILDETTFKSNASKDEAIKRFEELLAPKKSGGSRNAPLNIDGQEYPYCRFTGLYFPKSEMVYQNDEARELDKDKGYSKIGMSLWTKGQKYLKDTKMKAVEIAFGEDQSDETRQRGMELHRTAVELEKDNSLNQYAYLMENFLTTEQADYLESLDLPDA